MLATDPIRSALVVAPHADDEALGAGGLICRLSRSGVKVHVLFLAVDASFHWGRGETQLSERISEIKEAASILGYNYTIAYEGKGLLERLDTLPRRELVDLFESQINEYKPDLLVLPHGVDYDQDHVACFAGAFAAARPMPSSTGKWLPKKVITYEMPKLAWTSEQFKATLYFELHDELEKKLLAIAAYTTQLRPPPHIRSLDNIRSLAMLRGSEVGVQFAEGYHVLRWAM